MIQEPVQNMGQKSNLKKVVSVSTLAIILLVASFVVPMMLKQNLTIPAGDKAIIPPPHAQKIYTQEEKAKILEALAKSVPINTVSQTDRARTLKKLSVKAATATTTPSAEDRLRILQALAESARR